MLVKKMRLGRGWSQGQLAEFSGLSLRTIQRIEKGNKATAESLKALASVFETDISGLEANSSNNQIDETKMTTEELTELEHIRNIKNFVRDVMIFIVTAPLIIILSWVNDLGNWSVAVAAIWGAWLAYDAFDVFDAKDFFGSGWEKRQLEKRLGRKLD